MARNYKAEYRKFQSSRKSKLDRASRNKARRKLMASGAVSKGDGRDIDHRDKNPRNNSRSNLRITSKKLNRGKYRVAQCNKISVECGFAYLQKETRN